MKKEQKKRVWKKVILPLSLAAGMLLLAGLAIFSYIDTITRQIVAKADEQNHINITDRNGTVLWQDPSEMAGYSTYKQLEDINVEFKETFIQLEDRDFYQNSGLDFKRTARCLFSNLAEDTSCGASTITQQYVKLALNHTERTVKNKLVEALVSINLNRHKTKDEILELYLNSVYFGNLRYGVETASQGYFGKSNTDLDLSQVTFLAAIPSSPVENDPYLRFENTKKRQEAILAMFLERNLINSDEFSAAVSETHKVQNNYSNILAPHFVSMLDTSSGATEYKSTIDLQLYNEVNKIVKDKLSGLRGRNASNAAVVIIDAKTGEVIALLGSYDYFAEDIDGKTNTALSLRQPGSTLKPFTYGLGLSKGLTAATLIEDKEQDFQTSGGTYRPQNFDKKEHGTLPARETLANSLNIPAVMVLEYTGIESFYELAENVGLEEIREQNPGLTATLGGASVSLLDLTNAYRVFANEGGYLGPPVFSLDDGIETGKQNQKGECVFSEEIAFIISDILSDNDARRATFGSNSNLRLPFRAAAKTGTSTEFRDSWAIGYTNQFVVGVWVGNNNNESMYGLAGAEGAGLIWHDVMIATYDYYQKNRNLSESDFWFSKPLDLVELEVCHDAYTHNEYFSVDLTPHTPGVVTILEANEKNSTDI